MFPVTSFATAEALGASGRVVASGEHAASAKRALVVSERADRRTVTDMEKAGVDAMKMRDRIRSAVRIRLENHADARGKIPGVGDRDQDLQRRPGRFANHISRFRFLIATLPAATGPVSLDVAVNAYG